MKEKVILYIRSEFCSAIIYEIYCFFCLLRRVFVGLGTAFLSSTNFSSSAGALCTLDFFTGASIFSSTGALFALDFFAGAGAGRSGHCRANGRHHGSAWSGREYRRHPLHLLWLAHYSLGGLFPFRGG